MGRRITKGVVQLKAPGTAGVVFPVVDVRNFVCMLDCVATDQHRSGVMPTLSVREFVDVK